MHEKKFVENESNQGLESVRVFCFVLSGHFVGLALVHFLFNLISVVCFVSEYIELIYDCYVMQITVQNGCVAQFFLLAKVLLFDYISFFLHAIAQLHTFVTNKQM